MNSRMNWWKLGLVFSLIFSMPLPVSASEKTVESIQTFYQSSKSGKLISFVGDSTTEAAQGLYEQLAEIYGAPGGVLEGARIRNCGSSGNTLHHFVNQIATHGNTLDNVIQDQADLYVVSYGINDIRESSPTQIKADLKIVVDRLLKETQGGVLLRIPNPFLSVNRWSYIHLDIEKAQLYSDQLWDVYHSFRDYDPRVDILDIPSLVFGRQVQPEHPFMQDTIHPNEAGYRAIADAIAQKISGQLVKLNSEALKN